PRTVMNNEIVSVARRNEDPRTRIKGVTIVFDSITGTHNYSSSIRIADVANDIAGIKDPNPGPNGIRAGDATAHGACVTNRDSIGVSILSDEAILSRRAVANRQACNAKKYTWCGVIRKSNSLNN